MLKRTALLAILTLFTSVAALAQQTPPGPGGTPQPPTVAPAAEPAQPVPPPPAPPPDVGPPPATPAPPAASLEAKAAPPATPITVIEDGATHPMPSLSGTTGLLRVFSADSGKAGTFRFQFLGEYARATNFLLPDDTNSHLGGRFALSVSPWPPFSGPMALIRSILQKLSMSSSLSSATDCISSLAFMLSPDGVDTGCSWT